MLVMTLANSPVLLDFTYTDLGHLGEIPFHILADTVSSLFDIIPLDKPIF